jgi:anti-sigma regulatory factor (Ser/Thr protein kinase)
VEALVESLPSSLVEQLGTDHTDHIEQRVEITRSLITRWGCVMTDTHCRQAAMSLPGLPESVGEARAWALSVLPADCPRADDVALVVSELATNAVLHSASRAPGGTFQVLVDVEAAAIVVVVVDTGPALVPAYRPAGEGGLGLFLVTELADAYEVTTAVNARMAWCRLEWEAGE